MFYTTKTPRRWLTLIPCLVALLAAGAFVFSSGALADHKDGHTKGGKDGGGGGGGNEPVPAGLIYFYHWDLDPDDGDKLGCWSMLPDGSDKLPELCLEPSYQRHDDGTGNVFRWLLQLRDVEGTYPDGSQRRELFAIREDAGDEVQLTNDAMVKPRRASQVPGTFRWAKDDSFVSFTAVKWHSSDPTDVTSEIITADIAFDAGDGIPSTVAEPVSVISDQTVHLGRSNFVYGSFVRHDWSFDASGLVYSINSGENGTYFAADDLEVLNFDSEQDGFTTLFDGNQETVPTPEWSAVNGRIVYHFDRDIWTIKPDGSDARPMLEHKGSKSYRRPHWSPDGMYVTVRLTSSSNRGGQYTEYQDVARVLSDGSGSIEVLTDEIDDWTWPLSWR